MRRVVMLASVIGQVFLAGVMANEKMTSLYLVTHVKIAHFHRSRSMFSYRGVRNPDCGLIIAVHRRGGLLMPHFLQREAEDAALFDVFE
jgi:hypothetical protein